MLSWCHDAEFFCHPAAASQKASEDHLVEIEKSAISKKRSKLWFPSLNTIEVSRENQSRAKKGILVYQN